MTVLTAAITQLLLLLPLVLLPNAVSGNGGFFGRPAQSTPITSSGDAIVWGVRSVVDDDDNTRVVVELQVQVDFQRAEQADANSNNTADFAWIWPLPAVPSDIDVGSSMLFHALFQETLPTFVLDVDDDGSLVEQGDSTSTSTSTSTATVAEMQRQGGTTTSTTTTTTTGQCDASVLTLNCPSNEGPTRGGEEGGVTVWADGHAGVMDITVVQGTQQDVLDWLVDHGYALPDDPTQLKTVLQSYDDDEQQQDEDNTSVYVVMKVAPETKAGAVQPLKLEYELPLITDTNDIHQVHKVPTRLTRLSAAPSATNRTLQVYFFSEDANTRAIPVNYLDVTLQDAHVDWVGCLNKNNNNEDHHCYYQDYLERYQQALAQVEDKGNSVHALITEYNGPSSILQDKVAVSNTLKMTELETTETWLDFLLALEAASVPPIPSVQAIIDKYIPPKAFEINTPFQCVQRDHVYQPLAQRPSMQECFGIFLPPSDDWTWDPLGLAQELEETIFQPARLAQDMLDNYQSLTRLYGQIPTQSNIEPYFVVTTDKPPVDHVHRATAVPVCDLDTPNALEITLDDDNSITFWQPAILTCPTWQKTSPRPVFSRDEAQPRILAMAQRFTAWGLANQAGREVEPSYEDGVLFLSQDMNAAVAFGNHLLTNLTGRPTTTDSNDNLVMVGPEHPQPGIVILDRDPLGMEDSAVSSAASATLRVTTSMSTIGTILTIAAVAGLSYSCF